MMKINGRAMKTVRTSRACDRANHSLRELRLNMNYEDAHAFTLNGIHDWECPENATGGNQTIVA